MQARIPRVSNSWFGEVILASGRTWQQISAGLHSLSTSFHSVRVFTVTLVTVRIQQGVAKHGGLLDLVAYVGG